MKKKKDNNKQKLMTMNKKAILRTLTVLLPVGILFSCQEKIEENDLIEGKWRESSVVNDSAAEECAKQSYMEFSKYTYQAKDRTQLIVDKCSGNTTYNTYTVKGDTLIIVDDKQITKRYIIKKLTQTDMTYIDKDGNTCNYLRW